MKMHLFVFIALAMAFLAFSAAIYTSDNGHPSSAAAAEGKMVWQKYNCQSCHQLYGLGGYLGPDLTNVISEKGKGASYVLALVRAGVRQMPAFRLTEREETSLLQFLRQADSTGSADPRDFAVTKTGMIIHK